MAGGMSGGGGGYAGNGRPAMHPFGIRLAQRRYRRDLLENFRHYLAPQVALASPLLLDAAAAWGIDLNTAMRRMRPPTGWPYAGRRATWTSRAPRVEAVGAIGDPVQVTLLGSALEVRTWLGEGFVHTNDGGLQLWLDGAMPDALQSSLPGRELATVVSHPLLALRPYPIIRAASLGKATMIEAEAPHVPYSLSWS